ALGIDDINLRNAVHAPGPGDGAALAIEEGAPGDLFFLLHLLELIAGLIEVDADQGKRLALQPLHERPLVWHHGHARASPPGPEIKDHHLAPIITEAEFVAVGIHSFDVGSFLVERRAGTHPFAPLPLPSPGHSAFGADNPGFGANG